MIWDGLPYVVMGQGQDIHQFIFGSGHFLPKLVGSQHLIFLSLIFNRFCGLLTKLGIYWLYIPKRSRIKWQSKNTDTKFLIRSMQLLEHYIGEPVFKYTLQLNLIVFLPEFHWEQLKA